MIDLELFKHPVISTSIVMAVVSMIALVGFELLLSQELQFVHGFSITGGDVYYSIYDCN